MVRRGGWADSGGDAGQWRVLLRDARISTVDFYIVSAQGELLSHQLAGWQRPFAERSVDHHYAAFRLPLQAGEQRWVYLRIAGNANLAFDLSLWPLPRFTANAQHEYWLLGMFYGVLLLVVLCYNLFLLVTLHERSHLFLVLLIFGVGINQSGRDGLLLQFILPTNMVVPHGTLLTAVFALVAALLFGRSHRVRCCRNCGNCSACVRMRRPLC